jgi:DNA-binding response OmpR family regulator
MANILLVDDDDALRKMLGIALRRLGHDVVEVPNGLTAWEKFVAKPADVVIMDLIMPEKEGLETIMQFRRNGAKTKILAISGGGRIDARDMLSIAEQFGADKVLAKPFTNAELSASLKALLSEKS